MIVLMKLLKLLLIVNEAIILIKNYLAPMAPAWGQTWDLVGEYTGKLIDWMSRKFSELFEFIAFTIKGLPAIFVATGEVLGSSTNLVVETIKDLWNDGIDWIAAKFESWTIGLEIGLKSIRLWFSDMMVNIVQVVDSGFQGLSGKIVGMADLAANVLPDSWAGGIRSAGEALRRSSSSLVAEMRAGNNKIFSELEDLKERQINSDRKLTGSSEKFLQNQKRNLEQFTASYDRSIQKVVDTVKGVDQSMINFSSGVRNAVNYFENIAVHAEMTKEMLTDSAKSTQTIAQEMEKVDSETEKTRKSTKGIKKEVDKIADSITNNLNSAWDEFLENGRISFKDFARDIANDISKIIFNQAIAQPVGQALSSNFQSLVGPLAGSLAGSLGGGIGSASTMTTNGGFIVNSPTANSGGMFSNIFSGIGSLFGFARGGSFMVPGSGGTDSQPVGFMATPGEKVTVETKQQQQERGGNNYNVTFNVKAHDVNSFNASKPQMAVNLRQMIEQAGRYT